MKTNLPEKLLIGILALFSLCYFDNKTELKLEINGIVTHYGKPVGNTLISIYLDSMAIDQLLSKRNGRFDIFLDYQKEFIIEFSKEGYVTKRIIISTYVPEKTRQEGGAGFYDLNVDLTEMIRGLDIEVFNQPVTKYIFDPESFFYIRDEKFEDKVSTELEKVDAQVEVLKKKECQKYIKTGDNLLTKKDYENAWSAYTKALSYNPDEKYASTQLKKLKKLIKSEISNEEGYANAVAKADKYFQNNEYQLASEFYEKSLIYKPKELYPSDKLAEIDSINSTIFLEKRRTYENNISDAKKYIASRDYISTQSSLQKALTIMPDDPYAMKKLDEIDTLVKVQLKREEYENKIKQVKENKKYDQILARADSLELAENHTEALAVYNQAADLKPDEKYPDEKILEIQNKMEKRKDIEKNIRQHEEKPVTNLTSSEVTESETGSDAIQENKSEKPKGKIAAVKLPNKTTSVSTSESKVSRDEKSEKNIMAVKIQTSKSDTVKTGISKRISPKAENEKKLPLPEIKIEEKVNSYIEEANKKISEGDEKAAAELYNEAGNLYHDNNRIGKALEYYEKSLDIKKKTGDTQGIPLVLNDMAAALYDTGKFQGAIEKYNEAYELAQQTGDKKISSILLNNIAQVYENTYQYDNALNYYQKSVELANSLNNKNEAAVIYEKIADVHFEKNDFYKAIENLQQTLKIDEESDNEGKVGATLNNLGIAYQSLGEEEEALDYYEKSLDVTEKQGDELQVSIALNNIGNVNFDWQKFKTAIEYYEKSIKIKENIDYKTGLALSLHNIGNAYKALKNYPVALNFYEKSNLLAKGINYQEVIARNYRAFSEIYSTTKDYKNAFEFQKLFSESKYSIHDEKIQMPEKISSQRVSVDKLMIASLQRQIQRQKLLAELEANQRLKELEIKNLELENQHAKLRRMRALFVSSGLIILIIAGLLFLVYKQFIQKKKANEALLEKNDLITFQKQQITDSIKYASKIQKAVLPPKEIVTQIIPRHFILNKPRDIVSGDYYWTTQRGNESIIAVADCTGHGVPGAFMSMLGIAFLNEIVNKNSSANSHEILAQLRAHVMKSLHQTGKEDESKDGMDIALCIVDMQKKELQFSGAHNPLYLIRNNELTEIKADKMPIGISIRYNQPFTCHNIKLQEKDLLYIFSDGYYDQFGGINKKKFGIRRFKELLIEIHNKPMEEQQRLLEENFLSWKGSYDQLDDILVMGIQINPSKKSAS